MYSAPGSYNIATISADLTSCSAVEPVLVTYDRWLAQTDLLPDRFEVGWTAGQWNFIK